MCDGYASKIIEDIVYGGENLERIAVQDTKDETRHIHQHGQHKICPACNGTGCFISQEEGLPLVCGKCNGSGKLRA